MGKKPSGEEIRRPDCKDCRNARSKYAYIRDREQIRQRQRRWYETHREEHSNRVLAARAKRADEYREQQRLYRQTKKGGRSRPSACQPPAGDALA